jgi:hypothetical protein
MSLSESEKQQCLKLLEQISTDELAYPFTTPVDVQALGLND